MPLLDGEQEIVASPDGRFVARCAPKDGYAVFRHIGFFTTKEAGHFGALNKAMAERPEPAVVLDLSDTFLMDAHGIGNLVLMAGALDERGRRLFVLIDSDSAVRRKLLALWVDRVAPVLRSPAECAAALAAL